MYKKDKNNNLIHETAIICKNVDLGKNNKIMPYSVIGETGFIRNSDNAEGSVIIGDNNIIGCHTAIMVGESGKTIIGNDNLIMNYVNIGHNVKIYNNCEIGVGSKVCGWVEISNNVMIKANCTIRNRKKIGEKCLIGMGSNIVKDIESNKKVLGSRIKIMNKNE